MRLYFIFGLGAFFIAAIWFKAIRILCIFGAKHVSKRIWHVQNMVVSPKNKFVLLILRSNDAEKKRLPLILPDTPENRVVLFSLNPPYELVRFIFTYEMLWHLPAWRVGSYLLIKKASQSDLPVRVLA